MMGQPTLRTSWKGSLVPHYKQMSDLASLLVFIHCRCLCRPQA